jgi:hypothetical protein
MSFRERKYEEHPSYAVLVFSRVQCGGNGESLFGSTLKHDSFISMEIKEADRARDLNREWIHGGKHILIAYMSMNQFVEAIGKMNVGDGTPITLKYLNGTEIESPPYVNERKLIQDEFDKQINEFSNKPIQMLKKIREIINGKTVKKADLKEVVEMINAMITDLNPNIKYMANSVNEMIDKAVSEANMEIETSVSLAIRNAGIDMIDGSIDKLAHYINADKIKEIGE